ncbi:hypothetical protein SAMN04489802_2654 [Pseudomonas chlororaphis]|nr:hypothetical protein C4K17_3872 [Pseudomonas chlororaphis subsp. aurantiaca]SDS92156.1 hypothetical protein SAMN04489802_2654 [Pseudomonas chlororaphis]
MGNRLNIQSGWPDACQSFNWYRDVDVATHRRLLRESQPGHSVVRIHHLSSIRRPYRRLVRRHAHLSTVDPLFAVATGRLCHHQIAGRTASWMGQITNLWPAALRSKSVACAQKLPLPHTCYPLRAHRWSSQDRPANPVTRLIGIPRCGVYCTCRYRQSDSSGRSRCAAPLSCAWMACSGIPQRLCSSHFPVTHDSAKRPCQSLPVSRPWGSCVCLRAAPLPGPYRVPEANRPMAARSCPA